MRENGARRPVTAVCVHGAGGGGWEWGIWARVLVVRGFGVVAPDLMPAASGIAATAFADYRAQVAAWSGGVGAGVVLIGASLGGLLALAAAHEVQPVALVLINPMPPAGVLSRALHEPSPAIVPWARERSLASTRRAMPDADDAACLYALRRWRDESGADAAVELVGGQVHRRPWRVGRDESRHGRLTRSGRPGQQEDVAHADRR